MEWERLLPYSEKMNKELQHRKMNKKIKIEMPPLNPMVFYPGFPHIAEEIIDQLDRAISSNTGKDENQEWQYDLNSVLNK